MPVRSTDSFAIFAVCVVVDGIEKEFVSWL